MKRVCLFIIILTVSGLKHLRAAEAPTFGKAQRLLSIEQIYASQARSTSARNHDRDWMIILVNHGETVEKGQRIAIYKNTRGRTVLEYIASRSGRVLVSGRNTPNTLASILDIITAPHNK
ncbi:hypothetical protein [Microbulbifer sp. A4B17]|uniref:hypothetical protein n=1 Tax=Microbulbifer sp. A4B17 TaxID=359370 RepID=UPI001300839F|nr:hypothetical protein [Microbulbifer sp. A4B17]